MSVDRPFEMEFLPDRLRSDFRSYIPEAPSGTPEARDRNFLTRALAAFAVHKLSGCTPEEAAEAVVDGGGDGGIDAIHYSSLSNTLWVIQSKYIDSGRGEPSLGDVSKFKNGLEDLLQGRFDAFRSNPMWSSRLARIETYFNAPALRVRAVLVYSGINRVSEDRLRMFEDLKHRVSPPGDDYFVFLHYNLTSVNDWLTGADQGLGVSEVELEILYPGWIKQPYETVYGLVRLSDIATLHRIHGKRLIAANIRGYKGATDVNERILATLTVEPHHFFYLNNGLTAYCERLEVNNLDRANAASKRITARGFSIINGAQTLGSVEDSCRSNPEAAPDGFVFLKLISLERCLDDQEFAKRITQSTNFQNQIGVRDFVSLDDQQERIALQLRLANIEYHYKDDNTPDPDETNLTLVEATTALACLEQDRTCDFCSRVLANRNSLWSFEHVYPENELYRTRYHRLFRPDLSARTVWRAVQAQRGVIEQMRSEARSSIGIRKTFFENARWLVLNLIFLRLRPETGDDLSVNEHDKGRIADQTIEIAEVLWSVCETLGYVSRRADAIGGETYEQPRHFRGVFCSATDCERLRSATLAKLPH